MIMMKLIKTNIPNQTMYYFVSGSDNTTIREVKWCTAALRINIITNYI